MVNKKSRSRIKKSLSRIKSSISNSFKKSNYFQKSKQKLPESDSLNSDLEVSSVLEDEDGFYDTCDNNVQEPNGSLESTSSNLQYSYTSNHTDNNLDDENENKYGNYKKLKSLDKDELDRICKEYSERNGTDFLEVGLRTYIDAVIDTKNFRNRCFYVLSRRPYLGTKYAMDHHHIRNYQNYLISALNNENYKNKKALDLRNYRTTSESAHLTPRGLVTTPQSTNKQAVCARCSLTPSNTKSTPLRGNLKLNKNKLTPQKLTPPDFSNNYQNKDFNKHPLARKHDEQVSWKEQQAKKVDHLFESQGREAFSAEASSNRYTNKDLVSNQPEDEEIDLTDFMSRYNYLNSDQKDATPSFNLDNENENNKENKNKQPRKDNENQKEDNNQKEEDEDVLTHHEKLKLLEKIGIEDDYIAKRVCSKISGRLKSNQPEKKSLEDFNLFHKENLKHQLDVNYQLSQEIIQLSNFNTPDRSCSSESRPKRRTSLFKRISSTIDRNKDTSPTDIMNLTIP